MEQFKITEKRNLIVLDRTGVGKSTVVNQILGKTVFPVSTSSEEETEIEDTDAEGKVTYKIKIIDTVGLQDGRLKAEMIIKEIQDYLSRKAPEGVNLILFVVRKGVFTKKEKEAFQEMITSFKRNMKQMSALIITGCEGLGKIDRKRIVFETRTGQETEFLANFMGKDIHPVGFPNVDDLSPSMREEYGEGIKNDAEELRKLVLQHSGIMTLPQDIIEESSNRYCSLI